MIFSTPVLGTSVKKIKLNWWEYWIGHCWMTGWQSIRSTFRIWGDLLGSNYSGYALLKEDDPESECLDWFWASLNEDDTYPKEFLEELLQIVDDIDSGKEKLIPMDEVMMGRLKNLVGDVVDLEDTPE